MLALFLAPAPWGVALVGSTIAWEIAEKPFWFRYSKRIPIAVGHEAVIGLPDTFISPCQPEGACNFSSSAGEHRLLPDPRVSRRRKLVLVGLIGYLALPFDLVPAFIPIAGQLDDVIVVALVLRSFVRRDGAALLREHWPGPEHSLEFVLRAARVAT